MTFYSTQSYSKFIFYKLRLKITFKSLFNSHSLQRIPISKILALLIFQFIDISTLYRHITMFYILSKSYTTKEY